MKRNDENIPMKPAPVAATPPQAGEAPTRRDPWGWVERSVWTEARLTQLALPKKTRVVDASAPGGFDFLGDHFERGLKWPRQKSLMTLKERVRVKTARRDGRSQRAIVADVNRTLRGWHGYFQHSKADVFASVDGWGRRCAAGRTNGLPAVGCWPWQRNTCGRGQS